MATAKKSAKRGAQPRVPKILQIDPGSYNLVQGGKQVGQVVTVTATGGTTEYWYLYVSGYGPGEGAYTQPSPNAPDVTTEFKYTGPPPGGFDPVKYRSSLKPILVTYVVASCVISPPLLKKKPGAKKSPKK